MLSDTVIHECSLLSLLTCVSVDGSDVNSCEDVAYMAEMLQPSYQCYHTWLYSMQLYEQRAHGQQSSHRSTSV